MGGAQRPPGRATPWAVDDHRRQTLGADDFLQVSEGGEQAPSVPRARDRHIPVAFLPFPPPLHDGCPGGLTGVRLTAGCPLGPSTGPGAHSFGRVALPLGSRRHTREAYIVHGIRWGCSLPRGRAGPNGTKPNNWGTPGASPPGDVAKTPLTEVYILGGHAQIKRKNPIASTIADQTIWWNHIKRHQRLSYGDLGVRVLRCSQLPGRGRQQSPAFISPRALNSTKA